MHGPIEKLEDNLWRVEGSVPSVPLRRTMTIAKLSDGGLVIHSAIALNDYAPLDALGAVKVIVVPNGYHRLDAKAYAQRYPEARVLGPRNGKKRIEKIVATHGDSLDDRDVKVEHVAGTKDQELLMTVTSGTRTSVVYTDTIFNMPHKSGLKGFVLKHVMQSSGGPKVSRLARLALIKDKPAFCAQLEHFASHGVARVIVAHHEVISVDAAGALRDIASTLR